MEMYVLEEYVDLAETCSFQETAATMNISQSSLTKHIHKMEEEMGISLFDRSTRTVKINEFGKSFYPYAKQMIQLYKESMVSIQEMKDRERNQFSIAYIPVLGQYGLVDLITEFDKLFPENNMHTIETYQPISLLKSKKCDFAFVGENDLVDDDFSKMIFKSDHLAVVLSKDHPLAQTERLTIEQIRNEKFIIHSSATNTPHEETQKFMKLCEEKGITPNVVCESQFTSTMVQYAAAERGIAVLNRAHIPHMAKEKCAIIDLYPTIRTYTYLLYPRKVSSKNAADFLHFMIERITE